ncbi:hypothetical protein LI82_11305 [Methanococcoides methylutens]|uniref:Holliday junction resolvase n=1 Tax=Methanococcoides methylutens TaxID=2226 RepID=A0A099SZH0_METMT|nr:MULTISPECIES: hypothetical protein [Methanococcoides]KGK98295.1 hypothetical protein LI82_11305 [Methanococcoides methylutens]UGV40216.1 hypothetical protein J7W08_08940 [Methanococcoides orientis]
MTEFERELVQSFNAFFEKNNVRGIAHRLKQHRFTPQFLDVLVDSLNPDYYMGIECKSISVEKGANALYFTQHFTVDKKGSHQIDRISDFLRRSGRNGFLAVELRMGAGCARKAHIIPWDDLYSRFHDESSLKYTVEEIQTYPPIERKSGHYLIEPVKWRAGKRIIE